jgi:tetratricopeptide (TPR) repeat protein
VTGETATPLAEIGKAQELNPESRAIIANKAFILFYAGLVDDAVMILQVKAEPNLRSAPEYLATIYLDQGRFTDFLREYRRAAEMANNSARLTVADATRPGLCPGTRSNSFGPQVGRLLRRFRWWDLRGASLRRSSFCR